MPNLADFYTFYSFGLASGVAKTIWDMDLLEGYPQIATVMARMAKHPSVARGEAEKAIQPPRYCCMVLPCCLSLFE